MILIEVILVATKNILRSGVIDFVSIWAGVFYICIADCYFFDAAQTAATRVQIKILS